MGMSMLGGGREISLMEKVDIYLIKKKHLKGILKWENLYQRVK